MSKIYHNFDTDNSDIYMQSMLLNCDLKSQKEFYDKRNDNVVMAYNLSEDKTHMRCFKDPVLEQNLRTDIYSLDYKCKNDVYPMADKNKVYSQCLGYECNREKSEFMYDLDEFNTYHNYPVCKNREGNTFTCCPENIQIYNNWTKRQYAFKKPSIPKPLIMKEEKIPPLTYNECCYHYHDQTYRQQIN